MCTAKAFFKQHFSLIDSAFDQTKLNVEKRTCCDSTALQEQDLNKASNLESYKEDLLCHACNEKITAFYNRSNHHTSWQVKTMNRS